MRRMIELIFLIMIVASGCSIGSIPTASHPVTKGKEVAKADLGFIEIGVTTKAQVIAKLGQPELEYKAVDGYWHIEYSWKKLERISFRLTSVPIILPWPETDLYDCIIAFDSDDHVVGSWIVRETSNGKVLPQ